MNSYVYTKGRRQFGRQCCFVEVKEHIFDKPTDPEILAQHISRNPVNCEAQQILQYALSEVNTVDKTYKPNGMTHIEGGWPKDINIFDEEQTIRYKKRLEREDKYDTVLKKLCESMIHTIRENNAVNIFQNYFPDEEFSTAQDVCCENFSMNLIRQYNCSILKDACANRVHFCPKLSDEMVVSISPTAPTPTTEEAHDSYVWNIEYSNQPLLTLLCDSSLTQLEYNGRDSFLIAGGQLNGTVCLYDTRAGGDIQQRSVKETSHKDIVNSLMWIQSKVNTEFFTASSDGHVMWWDTRKMAGPYENYTCNVVRVENADQNISNFGCTTLEYSFSMPSRFMVATDNGFIFNGNKRGMTPAERFPSCKESFNGRIYSLARNPFAEKNYVAVGDDCFKIWSDDCREAELLCSKKNKIPLSCGAWSLKRGGLLFIGKANGSIDLWDLLVSQTEPIITREAANSRIQHICPHPDGQLVSVGHADGTVFIFQLSENLSANQRNERSMLSDLFDRETNREKNFHNKVKEYKLQESRSNTKSDQMEHHDSNDDVQAEIDYMKSAIGDFKDFVH